MFRKKWFRKIKKIALSKILHGTLGGIVLIFCGIFSLIESETILDYHSVQDFLVKGENYTLSMSEVQSNGRTIEYALTGAKTSWTNRVFVNFDTDKLREQLLKLKEFGVTENPAKSIRTRLQVRPMTVLLPLSAVFFGFLFFILMFNSFEPSPYSPNGKPQGSAGVEVEEDKKLSFKDVAGIDEVKEQIEEIVELFKDSSKIKDMGGKIPLGVLLNGPPGTGKTLLAKVTAAECGANFLHASGSEFVEMYVGVGARRIRDLFQKARSLAPCIVFIDEIDAVGGKRGVDNNSEREQTLNELLVQIDGFNGRDNILVFAATNQIEKLDPALLRPGRFDRQIFVNLPDAKGREHILNIYIKKAKVDSDLKISEIARVTAGFSGADLANLVNEAILLAARKQKDSANHQDFMEAKDKIVMGAERKMELNPDEKRNTAYHEIGHAIVSLKLNVGKLVNVSIIPRGKALGVTQLEAEDTFTLSRDSAINQLAMLMGGRVAEKIFFNTLSTGATNDLQRAYGLARQMVGHWGMSEKLGPLGLENLSAYNSLSEDTKKAIDQEVLTLIKDAEILASKLINEESSLVKILSEELFIKENMTALEISGFINQSPKKKHGK